MVSSTAAIEMNSGDVSELCGAREEERDETESVRVCKEGVAVYGLDLILRE